MDPAAKAAEIAETALRRAIEFGVNLIGTALAYGDGHSEKLVGQVVRESGTRIHPRSRRSPASSDRSVTRR